MCKWPKYQIKAAASASKQPLEFLCRSVQGNETTHWFSFHFKLTQISISHLLPEFWGGLEGTFWTCSPSPAHRYACSGGGRQGLTLPGDTKPLPQPCSHGGCDKSHQKSGAVWCFNVPPRLRVGRRRAAREAPGVWGGCRTEWNSFQLSRASNLVMKIASCRAAVATSKERFLTHAAACGSSPAWLRILPTRKLPAEKQI